MRPDLIKMGQKQPKPNIMARKGKRNAGRKATKYNKD